MRQGEIMALRWADIDLDKGTSASSAAWRKRGPRGCVSSRPRRRTVSARSRCRRACVEALKAHRKHQLELRLALGLGKPGKDALVFCKHEGKRLRRHGSRVHGAMSSTG